MKSKAILLIAFVALTACTAKRSHGTTTTQVSDSTRTNARTEVQATRSESQHEASEAEATHTRYDSLGRVTERVQYLYRNKRASIIRDTIVLHDTLVLAETKHATQTSDTKTTTDSPTAPLWFFYILLGLILGLVAFSLFQAIRNML